MTKYIGQCDLCKKEFKAKPRNKLTLHREYGRSAGFGSWGFARYYCDDCAREVMKAVRRFEMGGSV